MRGRLFSDERGLTLIELLVAAAMSVVIVGAGASMLISTVRSQPQLNERNQKVTEVRWVQERMTKELRNGVRVDVAEPTTVSFVTRVRTSTCGASGALDSDAPAANCQVTYDCSSGTCTRAEAPEGVIGGGAPKQLIDELESGAVFNYFPDKEEPTYVGIIFRVPNPSGSSALTVSDGASLRTPVLLSSG
jgi:type II secretory pathway pseudopilin PulG